MMISKYVEKNSYGGQTIQVALNSLFVLLINETNTNSYNVEFKEKKLFGSKVRFSFLSNSNLEQTTINAFDKIKEYFDGKSDYQWTLEQKNHQLNEVLNHYQTYNYE
jgi:hypothetical protein